MKRYEPVVFIQGDEATEPLEILDRDGEEALVDYLSQWDYGDHVPSEEDHGAGDSDTVREMRDGAYLLTYNTRYGYCGLCRIVEE